MKAIKFSTLAFLAMILLISSSCNQDDNDLNNDGTPDYAEFCGDLDGGDFDVSVEGQSWSTNCVQAVYSESNSNGYEQKILYMYAYNSDFTYFSDTDIEVAVVVWSEVTFNGETSTTQNAFFYKGFYDYSQAVNNPDYEIEELDIYISEDESTSDVFNVTDLTSNSVSGNLNFKLFEEDTNEEVTMSGSFTANIVQ